MIINFFEKIDLLGSKFHFYYGVSLKKRTPLGGILTLIIGIMTLIFLFIFGKDLFLKINPNVTISIQNNSIYEYIDLQKENITFAFRIENFKGHFLNVSELLYIKIYYFASEPDDQGKYKSIIHEDYMNYHICNDSDFFNENLTKYYGTLFCPDLGGKKFGGYFDTPYIYYFEFQLFFCKNGSKYSINNTCTSIESLKQINNEDNPIFFSFYYPVVEFDPLSYNNPLRVHHKNYYYKINHHSQRSDQIFLKKTILNDDKGYLLNKYKNISFWGFDKMISSYQFFSEEELTIEGASSKIYSLSIYNTVENNFYTRQFVKVQNVIAIVGTLINLLLKLFIFFNHIIDESLRKLEILNDFFEFKDKFSKKIFFKRNKTQKFISSNNISNFENQITNLKEKKIKVVQFGTSIQKFQNGENYNIKDDNYKKRSSKFKLNINSINSNKDNHESIINTTEQSNNQLFLRRKSVPILGTNIIYNDNNNFKRSNLTLTNILSENIKIYLFFCCSDKKGYTKYFNIKHSNLLQYYYIYLIQINKYLKIVHEYEFLKKALLNSSQRRSLLFLKRINLTNKIERDYILENKNMPFVEESVIDYYKTQLSNQNISNFDKIILKNLVDNIKEKIISIHK